MVLQPERVVAELRELKALTGDANGAQRVAWTPTWDRAREFYKAKLRELPVRVETDEAGNLWATLDGESTDELLIGGHIDSVPNGGWLDGCLNVFAGLEVLRRICAEGKPPITIRLVDWADEEGARFGRSLFGSSAASGTLNMDILDSLADRDGITLAEALRKYDLEFQTLKHAGKQLKNAKAYLELHIEQGPVLEGMELPLGTVAGVYGIERHAITFYGQAAHAGSTPMLVRRDALGAASKLALEIREIAKRNGGVCTVGKVVTEPGIPTAVVGQCDIQLDQRHQSAEGLAKMLAEAKEACARFIEEENVTAEWRTLVRIPPTIFNAELVRMCDEAIEETCPQFGAAPHLSSGPLHDACEAAAAKIPSVMLFVQSLNGLSHNKDEDTLVEHIEYSVVALDKLASKAIDWLRR